MEVQPIGASMQSQENFVGSSENTIPFPGGDLHPHLVVLYPQKLFKQYPLEKGTVILGRGLDADIRLEDELVSRKHCSITFDGRNVVVQDEGSTNGTFVDGNQVTSAILGDDNRLQVGSAVLKVEFRDSPADFDFVRYEQSTLDPQTGISNLRTFMNRSLGEITMAKCNDLFIHAIMVDVDHFKEINDANGTQCGDLFLKEIARLLKEEIRDDHLIARYGEGRFVVLMTGNNAEEAKRSAERMRVTIERHCFSWKDELTPVTVSIGIASQQGENISTIQELLASSKNALLAAKENGRNQVVCG